MRWAVEAKKYIRNSTNLDFGNLMQTSHDATTLKIAIESIKQMKIIILPSLKAPLSELLHYEGEDPETLTTTEKDESLQSKKDKDDRITKMLEQITIEHEHMALNSWRLHLARECTITFDKDLELEYT